MKLNRSTRIIIGVLAVIGIGLAGWSTYRTLNDQPTFSSELRDRAAQSVERATEAQPVGVVDAKDLELLDWKVWAAPCPFTTGSPTFLGRGGNDGSEMMEAFERSRHAAAPPTPVPPAAAVRVSVRLEMGGGTSESGIGSKVTGVQLMRSIRADGEYKEAGSLGKVELGGLKPIAPKVVSPAPVQKSDEKAKHVFEFSMVDPHVEAGTKYFYKVRLLHAGQGPVGESGCCSTIPMPVPRARMKLDGEGHPHLDWDAIAFKSDGLLSESRLTVDLACWQNGSWQPVHELARFPIGAGSFKVPVKATSPLGGEPMLVVALDVLIRKDTWSMKEGASTVIAGNRVQQRVDFAAPEAKGSSNPPWRSRGFILVESSANANESPDKIRARDAFPGTPQDSGIYGVLGTLGHKGWTFEINSQVQGRRGIFGKFLDRNDWQNENYYEWPGFSERCDYVFHWGGPDKKEMRTATVSAVRNPLPTGLVAWADDGQVRLRWDSFPWNEKDWAEGPYFVLRRTDQSHATIRANKLQVSPDREIFRTRANMTEYVDKDVRNGTAYFYTLEVTGVTRATSWLADVGAYEHNLPVRVRMIPGFSGYPVIAVPTPARPLRVSLVSDAGADIRVNSAHAKFLQYLSNTPGLELVERTTASSLFDEKQLAQLGSEAEGDEVKSFKNALTADLVLHVGGRNAGYSRVLDVWMDDFKNSRRERLVSVPVENMDEEKTASMLLDEIKKRFPVEGGDSAAKRGEEQLPVQTIAVTGFHPLTLEGASLSDGAIDDVLITALSSGKTMRVVEREKIKSVLKEQGIQAVADEATALKLGGLLKANAIVSGFYGLKEGKIAISARLIDVEKGALLNVVDVEGKLDDLDALGRQLASALGKPSRAGDDAARNPFMSWLESRIYTGGADKMKEVKTAAYVSPDTPDYHFKMGTEYLKQEEDEEALSSFYKGMKIAEAKDDPWPYYEAAGGILRRLKRTTEEEELWKRALADRAKRGVDADIARFNLARAQQELGRASDALATLGRVKTPSYECGRLYEVLGDRAAALRVYLNLPWVITPPSPAWNRAPVIDTLTPSYAAIIRLMGTSPNPRKIELLKAVSKNISKQKPIQAGKALKELLSIGTSDPEVVMMAAEKAESSAEKEQVMKLLEGVAQAHPNTLECMQALEKLAWMHRRMGHAEKSAECFQAVVKQAVKGEKADKIRESCSMVLNSKSVPRKPSKTSAAAQLNPQQEQMAKQLEEVVQAHPNTLECMQALQALGMMHRVSGNDEKAEEYFKAVEKQTVKGDQADVIRQGCLAILNFKAGVPVTMTATAEGTIGRNPLPVTSKVPDPERQEGASQYDVSESGVLTYRDSTGKTVLWSHDAHPGRPYLKERHDIMRTHTDLDVLAACVVFDGDMILFPSMLDGVLYALDRATGKVRWKFEDWTPIAVPVALGGRIYVGNSLGELFELSRDNGTVLRRSLSSIEMEADFNGQIPSMVYDPQNKCILFVPREVLPLPIEDFRSFNHAAPSHMVSLEKFEASMLVTTSGGKGGLGHVDEFIAITQDAGGDKKRRRFLLGGLRYPDVKGRERAVPYLIKIAASRSESGDARAEALDVLGEICLKSFVPDFLGYLSDAEPRVRGIAVRQLGKLKSRDHLDQVAVLLGDPDVGVRQEAVRAVILLGGVEAKPRLRAILNDRNSPPCNEAALDLLMAGDYDPEIISIVKSSRSYKDGYDADLILLAVLCRAGDSDALAYLDQTMRDAAKNPRAREVVDNIGKYFPEKRLIPIVAKPLTRDAFSEEKVSGAMGRIGDPAAIPYLLEVFWRPDDASSTFLNGSIVYNKPAVQNELIDALEKLTGQAFGDHYALWEQWWHQSGLSKSVPPIETADEALLDAAETGNVPKLKTSFDRGAQVDAHDGKNSTSLILAARHGNLESVEFLLAKGANLNAVDAEGMTPFLAGVESSNLSISRVLIEAGADVNVSNKDGKNALSIAQGTAPDNKRDNETEIMTMLEKAGVKVTAENLGMALLAAAQKGDLAGVRELLVKGAKVDGRNENDWTPLIFASTAGHLEMVQLLLEKGADVNARSRIGCTPLMFAADGCHPEVVEALLAHGANVNSKTNKSCTALHTVTENGHLEMAKFLIDRGSQLDAPMAYNETESTVEGLTPLCIAVLNQQWEIAKFLISKGAKTGPPMQEIVKQQKSEGLKYLIEQGGDVNSRGDGGRTAIFNAAAFGATENVKLLLSKGANPDFLACYDNGAIFSPCTALDVARQQRHPEVAEILKKAGAQSGDVLFKASTDLDAAVTEGSYEKAEAAINTGADVKGLGGRMLLSAITRKHPELLMLLLEKGAKPNVSDSDGTTPLMAAVEQGDLLIVRLLLKAGADARARSQRGETPLSIAIRIKRADIADALKQAGAKE